MSDLMILLNLWIAASLALGALWALCGLLLPRRRRARRAELAARIGCAALEDQPA
jgi:hypothetical protein